MNNKLIYIYCFNCEKCGKACNCAFDCEIPFLPIKKCLVCLTIKSSNSHIGINTKDPNLNIRLLVNHDDFAGVGIVRSECID